MFTFAHSVRFFSNTSGITNLNHLRKFYKRATLQKVHQAAHPKHKYAIKLDGKTIRTPNRNALAVPTERLALMLVHEFERQGEYLQPALMPFLSLCRTAVDVDLTPNLREHLLQSIYTYLPTDTLLFCADESSAYLQKFEALSPKIIEKFSSLYNMKLEPSYTLEPPNVSPISRQFHQFLAKTDNWRLIGLQTITIWLKSTITASLIINNMLGIDQALKAARLQQHYQGDRFGWVEQKLMEENNVRFMINSAYLMATLSQK